MFDTIVVATDGSASATRCVTTAIDIAARFDAELHAVYVGTEPADALATVVARADRPVETAIREGDPAPAIIAYARDVNADVIATGTRGRHGEHRFLLGSVAETVVRDSPIPVLTVRQLETETA